MLFASAFDVHSFCLAVACSLAAFSCGQASDTTSTVAIDAPTCQSIPRVNSGALTGSLTLRGHVLDSSGAAIVGARLDLTRDGTATRFSDLTGGYVFHVNPGSYSLAASGDCPISPSSMGTGAITAAVTFDFTATGVDCVTSVVSSQTTTGSVHSLSQSGSQFGSAVLVSLETNSADPAASLKSVSMDGLPTCSLLVAGEQAVEQKAPRRDLLTVLI
jgi:hypothetical protein